MEHCKVCNILTFNLNHEGNCFSCVRDQRAAEATLLREKQEDHNGKEESDFQFNWKFEPKSQIAPRWKIG